MGYASEKPDHALENVRPSKTLRGNTRYTGNLIAFRQDAGPTGKADARKRAGPQRTGYHNPESTNTESRKAESSKPSLPQTRTVQKPIAALPVTNRPANQPPARPSLSVGSIQSDRQATGGLAANNDYRHDPAAPAIRKSTLALAVIGSLSTGALLGSIWPVFNFVPGLQPTTLTGTQPIAATTVAEPALATRSVVAPESATASPILTQPLKQGEIERAPQTMAEVIAEPIVPVESTADALAKEYLVEIDWLIDQNMDLQQEVKSLSAETLELNQELLGLELQIASLEAEKESDTRTVYNFVDIPIGSDFTSSFAGSTAPSPGINDVGSPEIEEYYEPVYDDAEPEFDPYNEAIANELFQQDFIDDDSPFFDQGEPAFDLETGFYVDQQYVADVYQYEADAQVAYDPDTGFYVNPNFATSFSNDDYVDGQEIQDFPPIGQDF